MFNDGVSRKGDSEQQEAIGSRKKRCSSLAATIQRLDSDSLTSSKVVWFSFSGACFVNACLRETPADGNQLPTSDAKSGLRSR